MNVIRPFKVDDKFFNIFIFGFEVRLFVNRPRFFRMCLCKGFNNQNIIISIGIVNYLMAKKSDWVLGR